MARDYGKDKYQKKQSYGRYITTGTIILVAMIAIAALVVGSIALDDYNDLNLSQIMGISQSCLFLGCTSNTNQCLYTGAVFECSKAKCINSFATGNNNSCSFTNQLCNILTGQCLNNYTYNSGITNQEMPWPQTGAYATTNVSLKGVNVVDRSVIISMQLAANQTAVDLYSTSIQIGNNFYKQANIVLQFINPSGLSTLINNENVFLNYANGYYKIVLKEYLPIVSNISSQTLMITSDVPFIIQQLSVTALAL